jgi:predicted transcriptional regulator
MANKAIVSITTPEDSWASAFDIARRIDAGEKVPPADYHLNFANANQLFANLTPKRMEILERLKTEGGVSVYRLAKLLSRNYSNVHTDVAKLMEMELLIRDEEGKVFVPWDDVEIHLSLAARTAA